MKMWEIVEDVQLIEAYLKEHDYSRASTALVQIEPKVTILH